MDEENRNQQFTSFNAQGDNDNSNSDNKVVLESVHSTEYSLSYTFFLIPETPSFQLTGELTELLPKWLKEICVSNGWQLEFTTVEPKYLQWGLSVPTNIATVQVVKQVRTQLTKHILDEIMNSTEIGNLSDLWAPGYLLLHGLHYHPIEIIEQYIRLIWDQQQ